MVRIREQVSGVEIGRRYGRWEVLGHPFSDGKQWWCAVVRCSCGRVKAVSCSSLACGGTNGCASCRTGKLNRTTHGEFGTRLHHIWTGIKQRCLNPRNAAYRHYGGRGIGVCQEWAASYKTFRDWEMSHGYADDKQIDRTDNDRGYEPGNCCFVSVQENQRNRRSTKFVTAFGERKSIVEWSEDGRCVVKYGTLIARLRSGWLPEKAITQAIRKETYQCES